MAKPLGQVVFKVPELGKQGYQLELQQEARQEKREKERDREIYRTGGESAFNDNAYKLKGRYLTEAQDLYKEFEKVGAMFKQTNDPSLLRKANELSNQIKGVVNDFNTQVGVPLKLAAQADTKQWQGYMGNRDDFDKNMEAVLADVPHKIINNRMHYLWQGEYLPKEQTPWGSGKPNEYNTVMVRETTDLGKYVVPSYYEKGLSSLAENTTNPEHLAQAVSNQFNYDLENIPSLAADVAVAYAIHAGKLSAKDISVSDMQEIVAKYSDPNAPALRTEDKDKNFQTAANDWYRGRLLNISANRYASKNGMFADVATETTEAPAEAATEATPQTASGITIDDSPEDIGLVISDTQPVATETPVEEVKEEPSQEAPVLNPPAPSAMQGQSVKGKGTVEDPQSYKDRGIIPPAPDSKEGVPVPVQSKEVPSESSKPYYVPVDDLIWTPETVKKAMDRWNTDIPVPYEDFIYVSNKYGIPVEVIIAMAAKEGNIGVGERQVKTKNFFNWGNTTAGDKLSGKEQDEYNRYFSTWRDGLEVWADGMVRLYRPEDGDWSKLWSGKGTFVNKDGKRYAADENYEESIRSIIKNSLPKQLGDNYIAAR